MKGMGDCLLRPPQAEPGGAQPVAEPFGHPQAHAAGLVAVELALDGGGVGREPTAGG